MQGNKLSDDGRKQNPENMKKFTLPALLCLVGFSSFAQVENGSFESWTKLFLFEHPIAGMKTMSSNYDSYFANGELNVYEVEAEDNTHMRIENMETPEEVIPGYYLIGDVPSAEEGDLIFGGGFELSDLNATGISADIKMDIPLTNPGFVLVQFKSNGTPVGPGNFAPGTYVFYVVGDQDWTNMEFDFDGPLDPSTDECVIGFASADLIGNDSPFAPEASIEIDNIALIDSDVEVPAANFEAWDFVAPIEVPENCHVEIHPFDQNFEKSFSSFDENIALGLQTRSVEGQVEPARAVMADVNDEGEVIPTIAIESNHSLLSFRYFYQGVGEDVAQAVVTFYGGEIGDYNELYTHKMDLPTTGGYSLVEYGFEDDMIVNFPEATMVSITFASSKASNDIPAEEGSHLLVDDVQLSGTLSILDRVNKNTDLGVLSYPNPTNGRVSFDFGSRKTGYVRVLNSNGVQVGTRTYNNMRGIGYDLTEYPAGNYLFKFYHTDGRQSTRVMRL